MGIRNIFKLGTIATLIASFSGLDASAQNQQQAQLLGLAPAQNTQTVFGPFTGFNSLLRLGASGNFYETDSSEFEQGLYTELMLSGRMKNGLSLFAVASASKDLYDDYEQSLDNGLIGLAGMNKKIGDFILVNSFSAIIPMSEISRKTNPLKTSLRANPGFIYTPSMFKGLTFIVRSTLGKNFHDFTTKENGDSNASFFVRPDFMVSQNITDKVMIGYRYRIVQGFSYDGERLAPRYGSYFNLDYMYSPTLAFGAGLSTSGNMYREDGATSDVQIFDNRESRYNLEMSYSF